MNLRTREIIARAGIGLGGSELAGAERAARALIREAPFRESGYVLLMRALVASGNTAEALRTYDELRNLLAEELGSAPGAEAQTLHRKLLGGSADRGAGAREHRRRPRQRARTETGRRRPSRASPADLAGAAPAQPLRRPHGRARAPRRTLGRDASRRASATSSSSAAIRASARPGWRPSSPSASTRAEAASSTAAPTSRRARAFRPFVEALRHWVLNSPAEELERDLGPHAGVLASLIPEISVRLESARPSRARAGQGAAVRSGQRVPRRAHAPAGRCCWSSTTSTGRTLAR